MGLDIQHVDVLIPAPVCWACRVGVCVDLARSIFYEKATHGRASRPAIEPDRKRRRLRIVTGFKEPEEAVDRVVLALA